ncbi:hypothetical protein KXR53_05300 [Inquilinus limosus]|uniref:hypothetical protein n=1 Tax=Inquilinus limosus TaxID=171674 RepID=UPI003F16C4EA
MPPIRPALLALPLLLAAAAPAGAQEAEGWGTGTHMGTDYAGLTNPDGAHLGVYCAENIGPQGSAPRIGPYVLFSVPRKLNLPALTATVTFTVDGKATPVPMTVEIGEATTGFEWRPGRDFPTEKMKVLVEAMRRGKALTVGLADPAISEPFTLAGSGAALENIFDCGKR